MTGVQTCALPIWVQVLLNLADGCLKDLDHVLVVPRGRLGERRLAPGRGERGAFFSRHLPVDEMSAG